MDPYTQKLIESFQLAPREKKLKLLPEISKCREDGVIQFLVNVLGDEHWIVRKAAADCLHSFQDAVIPFLSAAISSYSEDIQHWALQVLTRLGKKGAPAILRALKSTNPDVRHFACIALGELREAAGIAPLIKSLGDEKWPVRKAASDALVKFGDDIIPTIEQIMTRTQDEDVRFWAIKSLGKLGTKAQRILLDALRTGDKQLRYVIAAALGESGDRRVIKVLIDSLGDPDWTIRKSATLALAEIGGNAIEPLIEALKEPSEDIRDGALMALVRIGETAMNRLFSSIEEIDDNQRYLIRKSMVKIGARAVEHLLRLFRAGKPEVMAFCAATLGEIGNPRAVPVLIDGLSHDNWSVRRSCAYALGDIGEKGVDRIAEALKSSNDDVRYWVTRILESIGEAGLSYLVKALSDKNKSIRFYAAKALRSSNNPESVRYLVKALADPSWTVRKVAAESIVRMESVSIEHLLRNISNDNEDIRHWVGQILQQIGKNRLDQIHECLKSNDPELRLYAAQALGIIADPRSTEVLTESLKTGNEWTRIYTAIALGQIGDARAVIPLLQSLSDRNAEVHRNIMKAFKKLGPKVFDTISQCVEGNDAVLRRNSAVAIGEMGEERGIDLLVILLADPAEKVRQSAAEALGRFPGLKAHTMLVETLKDNSHIVRQAAVTALAEHASNEGISVLFDFLNRTRDDREARHTRRHLQIMAQKIPQAFVALFKSEAVALRTLAGEALTGAGMTILPLLTELANAEKDETILFWLQKVIKAVRSPNQTLDPRDPG